MELTKQQKEMLRWFAAGHSTQMVSQFVDKENFEVVNELHELGVEDRWQAEALLADNADVNQLINGDDNLPNAGEEVPPFKQDIPNKDKLKEYDKREIADRGGNQIDLVPLPLQQSFKMDIRWRTLSEISAKWLGRLETEDNLKAAIKEYSPSAFKRLYGKD